MVEWRDIPNIPGYLVSSDGQVKHKFSPATRKLHTHRNYKWCSFRKDGKNICRTVHSLVASAFLGPKPNDTFQIRHLDGNGSNNDVSNLAYGSAKENADDREWHGTTARGDRSGTTKLPDSQVVELRKLYATGKHTQYELADRFGISQAQVNNIVLDKQRRSAA